MNSDFVLSMILKTTIVLACSGLVSFAFRRSAAAIRHVIWSAGLVGVLVLPLLSLQLPTLELRILPHSEIPNPPADAMPVLSPTPSQTIATPGTPPAGTVKMAVPAQWNTYSILFLWIAGAALVAGRSLLGFVMIGRLKKRSISIATPQLQSLLEQLLQALSIHHTVSLRLSDRQITPMTQGLRSSTILLPAEAKDWPEERLRFVLSHELGHVKRRDVLMQVPIQIACILHWFNPLLWIAHHRFLIERERACDDFVINAGARPEAYADHLLHIARSVRQTPGFAFAGISIANRSQLETRLLSILDVKMNRRTPDRIALSAAIVVAMALLIPLAAIQLHAQAPKQAGRGAAQNKPTPNPQVAPQIKTETPSLPALEQALQEKGYKITDDEIAAYERLRTDEERAHFIEQFWQRRDEMLSGPEMKAYQDAARRYHELLEDPQTKGVQEALEQYRNALRGDQEKFNYNSAEIERQAEALRERFREIEAQAPNLFEKGDWDKHLYESAFSQLEFSEVSKERLDQAVGPIIEALQDQNAEVRRAAAEALGDLRDQRAVGSLLRALSDENAEVRRTAAAALGDIRDTTATSALIQAMKDPNAAVRRDAIVALGNLGSGEALNPILAAMKDSDPSVRAAAIETLPKILRRQWRE